MDGDFNMWSELGLNSNLWWKVDFGCDGLVIGVRFVFNVISYGSDFGVVKIKVENVIGDIFKCVGIDKDVVNEFLVNYVVMYCDVLLLGRYVWVEMMVVNICSIVIC